MPPLQQQHHPLKQQEQQQQQQERPLSAPCTRPRPHSHLPPRSSLGLRAVVVRRALAAGRYDTAAERATWDAQDWADVRLLRDERKPWAAVAAAAGMRPASAPAANAHTPARHFAARRRQTTQRAQADVARALLLRGAAELALQDEGGG